jgi:hypothetical protein
VWFLFAFLALASKFTSTPPPNISCVAGQALRLQCSIKATPPIAIRWLKDGQPLLASSDSRHRYRRKDILCILFLSHGKESKRINQPTNQFFMFIYKHEIKKIFENICDDADLIYLFIGLAMQVHKNSLK